MQPDRARRWLAAYAAVAVVVVAGPSPGPVYQWFAEGVVDRNLGVKVDGEVDSLRDDRNRQVGTWVAFADDVLNVAAVVPAGFLLPQAFPQLTPWLTVLYIAVGSAVVELSQALLLSRRAGTIGDVGTNTLGGLLGTALFLLLLRSRRPNGDASAGEA